MNPLNDNIEQLIDFCIEGKEVGYKAIYKKFYGFGKVICLRHASNKEDAEEILNDTFIKVFKNLAKYDKEKSFLAWFRKIIINTCIDYYRSKKQLNFEIENENLQLISQIENILQKFAAEDILSYVQKLSPACRTVFLLYVVEGYGHKEISKMLNISEITSRTNLNKARMKLQNLIIANNKHVILR